MDKPYTTYDEQIKILKSKKLVINDEEHVLKLLKKCSYYGLITGYKHPFKDKERNYKIHTTIDDIYALYSFDMELRQIFLKYILIIENHMKSLISYWFCNNFDETEASYLNVNNYDYTPAKQDGINKLVGKLKESMCDYGSHPYLQHQKQNHDNVPLWVLTKVLTMGVVSKMYSFLQPHTQTSICKEFMYVSEGELSQMIDLLSSFRNVCAHNERLYDYKSSRGEIRTTHVHQRLGLRKKGARYLQGKNDLFAIVIIFKYLLENEELEAFIEELERAKNELFKRTTVLQPSQVMKLMGFPDNWKMIKDCPKHKAD